MISENEAEGKSVFCPLLIQLMRKESGFLWKMAEEESDW